MYNLFIDDDRYPQDCKWAPWHRTVFDWEIARNIHDVEMIILIDGPPMFISFDHDLGKDEKTGYDITKWLVDRDMDTKDPFYFPEGFDYSVHSQNPVGAKNIQMYMNQYLKHKGLK